MHNQTAVLRLLCFAVLLGACDGPSGPGEERVKPEPTLSIASGESHTCALTSRGEAYCWGANLAGQLGTGTTTPSGTPVAVTGGMRFVALSAVSNSTCALTREGAAYCWGSNDAGQLGTGSTPVTATPQPVTGGLAFSSITIGGKHACGLTTAGEAYCWGDNTEGRLGTGLAASSPAPVRVSGGLAFRSLSAGLLHTCGITTGGAAYCWGSNAVGQRGVGRGAPAALEPVAVGGPAFESLSAGGGHTCAVATGTSAVHCWGYTRFGQAGSVEAVGQVLFTPTVVAGSQRFTTVYASRENYILGYSCGIAAGGAAFCWGSNETGQLGTTASLPPCQFNQLTFRCTPAPVPVAHGFSFRALAPGKLHTCGLTTAGEVYCWGANAAGQLGTGAPVDNPTPVKVAGTLAFAS